MNKKMREIRAEQERLNNEAIALFEDKNIEGAEAKLAEVEALDKEYVLAEKLYKKDVEEVATETKAKEGTEVTAFASAIRTVAKLNETTGTEGGYTVPEDILAKIETLREAKFSLASLVGVETVTTNKGSRTFKTRAQATGFTLVGEGGKIGASATPKFERVNYEIKKYAGYLPVTNELLEDSDASLTDTIITWLADESRATRNNNIRTAIATKEATAFTGLDDIKKALNVTLGQAFKATAKVITNDDGLNYLDTLKDNDENYKLQVSPVDPMKLVLCAGATAVPVVVVPNADLPTEGNKIPFIVGDLNEGIRLFDRKKLNIMTSNVASVGELNAFEEDLTLFRGIEREDVQVRDAGAFVNGYITATATV